MAGGEGDVLRSLALDASAPRGQLCDLLRELAAGKEQVSHVVALDAGEGLVCLAAPAIPPCLIVPGSFNPLHEGHEGMAGRAADATGRDMRTALFEICVGNADKGFIDVADMCQRVEAIVARGRRALVTRATFFAQKAALCEGCDFAIGYDTYARIVDARYYVPSGASLEEASEDQRLSWVHSALLQIKSKRVRLAVAGRLVGESFKSLETDPLYEPPEALVGLFLPIAGFRCDMSSTELRKRNTRLH